ncbi:MAG TPA: alpha/beta hydrolase [Prosthecobacter sp.]|nr:alpha/beta hydrolase [Prosthecobacter sp.]
MRQGSRPASRTPSRHPPGILPLRDLDYGGEGDARQKLDLYVPEKRPEKLLPLIIFIHGGGWHRGSKNDCGIIFPLLGDGAYVAASLNYRLTDQAQWPAQIHDCKAALRWLGAHAADYGIDPTRIGLIGISAGGHLVSLLSTSQDIPDLDGQIGSPGPVPKIACVANFAGPGNLLTFPGHGSIIDPEDPASAIAKLLGGPMSAHLAEAKAASPNTYITPDDPPFLIIFGSKDTLVPYAQAEEMDAALGRAGVPSTLLTAKDGPHVFVSPDLLNKLRTFFDHHLHGAKPTVPEGPVRFR